MASDETRRRWACFRHRRRHLFEQIEENDPGFWIEAADIWQAYLRDRVTTRGAVVTEFPATRGVGTQTGEVADRDEGRSVGTQTEEASSRREGHSQGTQTIGVWDLLRDFLAGSTVRDWRELATQTSGEEAEAGENFTPPRSAPETPPETPQPEAPRGTTGPDVAGGPSTSGIPQPRRPANQSGRKNSPRRLRGCWNCWSRRHTYADCPRPRENDFCFRCGEPGTTVKDCLRCRGAWKAQGPYVPGKGHVRRGSR